MTFKYMWEPWVPTKFGYSHCNTVELATWFTLYEVEICNYKDNQKIVLKTTCSWGHRTNMLLRFSFLCWANMDSVSRAYCKAKFSKVEQTEMFFNEMTNSALYPAPLITWIIPSYNRNATWCSTSVTDCAFQHQHLSFTFNMVTKIQNHAKIHSAFFTQLTANTYIITANLYKSIKQDPVSITFS